MVKIIFNKILSLNFLIFAKIIVVGKRNKNIVINGLLIYDVGADGLAVARYENFVVFVTGAVPGDVVDVLVTKKKKNYAEAVVLNLVEASPDRVQPFCKHFGICGGCKWQHLLYQKQLFYKEKQVNDQLARIGKIQGFKTNPILASENEKFYRNKLEFTFSSRRWLLDNEPQFESNDPQLKGLGFHVKGMFDKVVDIEECYLQKEPSNQIRNAIKKFALDNSYDFYNVRTHEGFLRNLIIRNTDTEEWMLIIVFAYEDKDKIEKLLNFVVDSFPEINSVIYFINPKSNDSLYDLNYVVYKGNDFIVEELNGIKYRINPKSFFQTNTKQTINLYETVLKFASPKSNEIIYDLYTGAGTIALYLARHCKKVVGVDSVAEAIDDAVINSELNGLSNTLFYSGDMKDIFTEEFISYNGNPDVIVLDPPRAGVHENVLKQIKNINLDRIVYVSCNPATQARDIEILSDVYKVVEIQPVDMFPHTHHIENVALLKRIR